MRCAQVKALVATVACSVCGKPFPLLDDSSVLVPEKSDVSDERRVLPAPIPTPNVEGCLATNSIEGSFMYCGLQIPIPNLPDTRRPAQACSFVNDKPVGKVVNWLLADGSLPSTESSR